MSELSQDARDLIESTIHADDPSQADRTRVRARLAAQLGAAAVAATLGATQSTMVSASTGGISTSAGSLSAPAGGLLGAGGFTGLFKVAVATGLAGVIGGSVAWFSRQSELSPQRIAARSHSAQADSASPPNSALATVNPTVEPLAATPALEARENADLGSPVRERGSNRRGVLAQENQNESTLSDELALLARAQQALRDGNSAQALVLAGQHRERFPRGSLREERFGIEALARCALGHDGTEVVAALARLSPSSPLLIRVRAACGIPQ